VNPSSRLPLPPYAARLSRDAAHPILVMCGSGAWEIAKRDDWFPGWKIIFPWGEDIGAYHWPVAGRSCLVQCYGSPEPDIRLQNLCVALVRAGASRVFGAWTSPVALYRPRARAA
jgi:hypothetical protein